jgi:feruloyl-CoA synthase
MIQYAGAGMSQHTWDALAELAVRACGERIFQTTGYGSTETAPFSFTSSLPVDRPGIVGLPVPGNVAKLVPTEGKLEVRIKGPNVTPGYWRQPDATAAAFDEEGYYRMGDALCFVDESNPQLGFKFDGRISEDFKLSTGTWVNVGGMRAAVIAECAPYVRDVVICGLNKDYVGALIFPDLSACGNLAPRLNEASADEVVSHPEVRAFFLEKLRKLAVRSTGSSTRLARAILLAEPPSMDRSEMTDKGSINQRAVLENRAALVDLLYAEPLSDAVLATDDPS